jgi:hypothetical protein
MFLNVVIASASLLGHGDVVAVSLPNIPQYLVPALGAIHAGDPLNKY